MSSDRRQEQQTQKEFDGKMRETRHRLSEQLACLDKRAELEREQLQDFQEYFQARAEIEREYAKNLERLHDKHAKKRRIQTPSKDAEPKVPSTTHCWNAILDMTKNHHKQHSVLGTIYGNIIAQRFSQLREGLDNIYRKSREMTVEVQSEIHHVVTELFSALKTYQVAHSESKRAKHKQEQLEQEFKKASEKGSAREKAQKQIEKAMIKFHEADLKSTKARNDYLLTLAATNRTLEKYFDEDAAQIVDCVDVGYVPHIKKTLLAFLETQSGIQKLRQDNLKSLEMKVRSMNSAEDKQLFLSSNEHAFQLPTIFSFQQHGGDEICAVNACYPLDSELGQKYDNLRKRCDQRQLETEEVRKSLDAVQKSMQDETFNIILEDVQRQFQNLRGFLEPGNNDVSRSASLRRRMQNQESELYYLEYQKQRTLARIRQLALKLHEKKFKEYMEKSNSQARIQARRDVLQEALNIDLTKQRNMRPIGHKKKKLMKLRRKSVIPSKLFGGSLKQFLANGENEIPPVVESCIEFITLYGLDHEGIFRMPGSQTEVNEMKTAFEKGDDPLPDLGERGDVHLVASVLKAYFRELTEPLFPENLISEFLECCKISDTDEKISALKALVQQKLDQNIMIVMRYLFDFLKNLSLHHDETMMDSHNLAVCFGPTLVWPPEGYDPVSSQSMVIDLVDTMILFAHDIFPQTPGLRYKDADENDISPSGSLDPIPESDGPEEDLNIPATCKSDYSAKSNDELSFRRGQNVVLLYRVTHTHWQGRIGNQHGLISNSHVNIPDKNDMKRASKSSIISNRRSISDDSGPLYVNEESLKANENSCGQENEMPVVPGITVVSPGAIDTHEYEELPAVRSLPSSPETPDSPTPVRGNNEGYKNKLAGLLTRERPNSLHDAPAIVTDHIGPSSSLQENRSRNASHSFPGRTPPPVKPKPRPMRPVPSARQRPAPNPSHAQTL